MPKDKKACKVTEITPAMIAAGVIGLNEVIVGEDLDSDVVYHIFDRMVAVASLICPENANAVSRVATKRATVFVK